MADPTQTLIFRTLAQRLAELGLGTLAGVDARGNPTGWLWEQIKTHGQLSDAQLQLLIEDTAEFKARFPVIAEQRRQAAAGQPIVPMNAAQVRQYEESAASLMRYARLPNSMSTDWRYAQNLLGKGISIDELSRAITTSYERVARGPSSVRQYMATYYGPNGDSLLAAYFLDPDHIDANLETVSRAASIGGYAADRGITLSRQAAERIAATGAEGSTFADTLNQVAAQRGLFDESISETKDLTTEAGTLAAAGLDETTRQEVRSRVAKRQAAFAGGGGGMISNEGLAVGRTKQEGY